MSITNITSLTDSVIEQIPNYYRWRRQILFIFNERDILVLSNGWKMIVGYRYLYTRKEHKPNNQGDNTNMTKDEVQALIDKSIVKNNKVNNAYILSEVDKKIKENNEVNNKYLLSEVDKKIKENNEVNNAYLLSEVDKKIKENNEVNNKYLLSEMDKKDAALLVAVENIVERIVARMLAPVIEKLDKLSDKLDKVIELNNLKTE